MPKGDVIGPDTGHDRTLLVGYNADRRSMHVYQKDGLIHVLVYSDIEILKDNPLNQNGRGSVIDSYLSKSEIETALLIPNKRLYPDFCDFAFCKRLKDLGVNLPFTTHRGLEFSSLNTPFVRPIFEEFGAAKIEG